MKMTKWIILVLGGLMSVAVAGDIVVKMTGQYGEKTVTLTTNAASLVHLNWDGAGKTGGGQYDLHVFLEKDHVVLVEKTLSANGGIVNDTSSKTVVPTNLIPQTLTIGQTTVTVSRAEEKTDKQESQHANAN
jgi:hypothetical protein